MDSLTNFSCASPLTTESSQGESSAKIFMSVEEEESWRKDRRKKDNHNISKYPLITLVSFHRQHQLVFTDNFSK